MTSLPLLGLLLLLPTFAVLAWLGLAARRPRRRSMLLWTLAALAVATAGCLVGAAQPPQRGHVLWPQVAAATLAFIGFVSVWAAGLWATRPR